MLAYFTVAEWLASWTTESATSGSIPSQVATETASSNSALGDYLIGHCYQQCWPVICSLGEELANVTKEASGDKFQMRF